MPIKNLPTKIPCKLCKGKKTVRYAWTRAGTKTEPCDRCKGTGIEPMPKANVDRGPIKP